MSITQETRQSLSSTDIYDDGYLRVEHRNYYVSCAGQSLRLPRTEFLIFSRLARSPERIVTVDELWEYAWGREKPLNSESLHVYIYRLRHKLVPYSLSIETMVNVGYRLLLNDPANGYSGRNLAAKTLKT
ncbi:MAG TPA: winged helix-turn-helix domain-containing protein [Pyrinomonadaceae bacterium]|nr:winged helix-turn-helix domain-containing protein [Pyrinomonadaceae bacterium]